MKTAKTSRILSLLALVLIAAMMLTMVGCGGGDKEPDAGKTTTTTGDVATQPSDTDPTDSGVTDPTADDTSDTTEKVDGDSTTKPTDGKVTATDNKSTTSGGKVTLPPKTKKTTKPTTTTTTTKRTTNKDNDILSQVPSELKGTNIKMLIWWTSGSDDKAEAAEFYKKTGIKVAFETAEMSKYQQQLSAKVMAKNAPALAAIINEWYPQPITRGLMQPIDNVKGWNFKDEDVYALSLMDQFGLDGKHYGIALKGSNMTTFEVMFFNKNIMEDCGVKDDPYELWKKGQWNWDTCLKIAKQCTNDKKELKGITNVSQFFWMLSAGTDFVKADINGMKNNLKAPEVLNAWTWNWDMINTHKVVDTTYTGQVPFFQGKAAMLGAGSYMMQAEASHSNYVPQNMEDEWGVVPFPSPKGKPVAACEGTVWGFPRTVTGNKLQAGAWFLRYFLDDYNYSARDFYPSEECWEVMSWMWDQKIQSYNSVGVLTYGGEHSAWSIQYSLVDEADTKAKMSANLDQWMSVLDANIDKIKNELK